MKRTVILVALTMGLGIAAIGWLPSGTARSSAAEPAFTPAALPQSQPPGPIRLIPGLQSLTFWERTGAAPVANTFSVNSPQLELRLNSLDLANRDFTGAQLESYDVFYSDAGGTANRDGAYVTIEAVWNFARPNGGGLNIAEVQLNFGAPTSPVVFGNVVTSFVGLGDNYVPASVPNAVDRDLQTHTTMGNTVGQSQRLRITIGFPSNATASAHIDSLLPNQSTAGAPGFTLRILGTGFGDSDTGRLYFRGTPAAATLISPQELQARIQPSLIGVPGTALVTLVGSNSKEFTINPPLTITTGFQLPDAIPGQPYSQRLEVSGGTAPLTWSSTLPAGYGLSLSPGGLISGTAIPVETAFEFQATVTDAATVRAVRNFKIFIRYPCASGAPCLFIEDTQVTESDTGTATSAVFIVRLSRPSSVDVTVNYSTQDFTAAAPNDYAARNSVLTFFDGSTLERIVVPVRGDNLYEAAEHFYVNLTNPVNATIAKGQGICTIADNEPGTLTICANDVPQRLDATRRGQSTITVDRDGMIDDVNVSLFFEYLPFLDLNAYVRAPGTSKITLLEKLELGNLGRLGTTCSPSPNCIIDDEALTRIDDAAPPYVGSFKPTIGPLPDDFPFGGLRDLARKSHKGTWTLDFSAFASSAGGTFNCWCLNFDLPREGCRIAPERATASIFFPHTVKVFLTSNGNPVRDQVVSFTVRGEQDELRLQGLLTSDDLGQAKLSYSDFKPGPNFIEARAMVNGVLSIAKAQVTWVADGLSGFSKCPFDLSSGNDPEKETTLSAGLSFRDDVLAQTPRGQAYTRLYYEFSTEAVRVMMFNPMVMLRSREIIERYKPLIRAMATWRKLTAS